MFLLHSRVCISFTPNIYLSFYLNLGFCYPFWKYSDMGFSIPSRFALIEPISFWGFGLGILNVSQFLPGSMSHCFHDWSSWYSVFGPWQTRWTLGYNECWTQVWIFPDLWIIHTIARLHLHKESCFLSQRSFGGEIIKKLLSVCLRSFDWLHSHLPFFRQQQTFSKSLPVY